MDAPSNKVTAATTAATVASALVTLGLWLLHAYAAVDVPPEVQAAVLVLVTALGTGLATLGAGYWRNEQNPAPSAQATLRARGWQPPDP